jgi:hypothetical protein
MRNTTRGGIDRSLPELTVEAWDVEIDAIEQWSGDAPHLFFHL